jgi:secreted Zn-dependent insulinase-like peptidase
MGTEKFSIENEYSQCLSANSGSSNAYTGPTSMNYFFYISVKPDNGQDPSDTNPSPLSGALDRFAQFFIEPLFLSETLDRELKAVDSENKESLFKMTPRDYISLKSLCPTPITRSVTSLPATLRFSRPFLRHVESMRGTSSLRFMSSTIQRTA